MEAVMELQSTSVELQIKSVTNTIWKVNKVDEKYVVAAIQKYNLPEIVARILAARNVRLEDIPNFLNPTLKEYLPDPFHLKDMEKAANRVVQAITENQTIAILGDYDVDGATSTSLLVRYFNSIGAKVIFHIPDRILEGYGPNANALSSLYERGAKLCLTVDCGTMSFAPILHAKEIGLDLIVIDHHLSSETLPEAFAIVNPNRLDETSEHGYMAAVGVCFLLIVAVNRILADQNYFVPKKAPDLIQLLDIVALGTVCDVVPLKKANRAFVAQGLKVLRKRQNLGLNALMDVAQINDIPLVYHLGFMIGPRINACGRIGKSDLGTKILTSNDSFEVSELAQQLNSFNIERKEIEQRVLEEALEQVESKNEDFPLIMVSSHNWHPGVIGIVAGRLKEKYHKPVAVLSLDKGIGKASARSISGVDFGSAIVAANQQGLLIAGGGHAMAAGFSVHENNIKALHDFLNEKFRDGVSEFGQRKLYSDGYLTLSAINSELIDKIAMVGPFGTANYEPQFIFPNVFIRKVDILAGQHIKAIVADNYVGGQGKTIKAMSFRSIDTPLGNALLNNVGRNISIVGKLKINNWQGTKQVEILIEDVAVGNL